ncbi:serine/threonine-protein kinase [Asanoa iriomotensis]|uniref:non-specific serine/threonine protein kinase n=1 Tax=Asanoa iriomotensis TaxID=234613 RepID=A0ABQ4C158_9ACTN|nr:serine/threonine-protein kinase [Asanoa iriomotensis]GIF56512.1 hypothetical protein Air01nite_26070 [Asanoa iriomotensis]
MTAETVLADRYVLEDVIGTGGMGRVWRGHDRILGRPVAVKEILSPAWLPTATAEDRWRATLREAQAASRLRHPNVVAVLDVIRTDRPWIIMEYVPARSLHDVLVERGPFDPAETARLGLEILAALDAAHRAGVIHRDVKPQNILLADDGRVVLTDFGLAVVAEGGVTVPDQVLGSPDFVAPEAARRGLSTMECDLWSLGATLYALVEGVGPFHRSTVVATLTALAVGPPDPTKRAGPLAPAILRLLERDPAIRARSDETRRLLAAVAEGEIPRRNRRHWRAVVVGAAALTLASAGTAAAVALPSSPPAPPPSAHACLDAKPDPAATAPDAETGAFALPQGWRWHTDEVGFTVAVPVGWSRFAAGDAVCFRAPRGTATLAVDPAIRPTADPADLWRGQESAAGALPGYARLRIGPVRAAEGGADWEFTWNAAQPRHARRITVTTEPGRAYALSWFTDDTNWPTDAPRFRLVASSYRGPS